jgi:hypothetical protein
VCYISVHDVDTDFGEADEDIDGGIYFLDSL